MSVAVWALRACLKSSEMGLLSPIITAQLRCRVAGIDDRVELDKAGRPTPVGFAGVKSSAAMDTRRAG